MARRNGDTSSETPREHPDRPRFAVTLTPQATRQLQALPRRTQRRYAKAFQLLRWVGPHYRSLRTHRYYFQGRDTWGSAASMALRFYWVYCSTDRRAISITGLDSH